MYLKRHILIEDYNSLNHILKTNNFCKFGLVDHQKKNIQPPKIISKLLNIEYFLLEIIKETFKRKGIISMQNVRDIFG